MRRSVSLVTARKSVQLPGMSYRLFVACLLAGGWVSGGGAHGDEDSLAAQAPAGTRHTNSVGIELVAVPAGTFRMGAIPPAEDPAGNAPVRDAEILLPFWMGTYEVSQKQWQDVMGTTIEGQRLLETGPDSGRVIIEPDPASYHAVGDEFPMTWVNWIEAKEFCRRLTRLEREAGLLAEHLAYDLATEVQWEYACRAGTNTRHWFGNDGWAKGVEEEGKTIIPAHGPYEERDRERNPGSRESSYPLDVSCGWHRLRDLIRNPFGLCNMHGGVGEWCRDAYIERPGGAVIEGGSGGTQGEPAGEKVVRPGGGIQDVGLSESHERMRSPATARGPWLGFRVVVVGNARPASGGEEPAGEG